MTKPIRIEPEAAEELLQAARWYQKRRPGLGSRFLAAVGAALEVIQHHPDGGAQVPRVRDDVPARQLVLRRFPYAVVFLELDTEIRVVAFAHHSRRPAYWLNRLQR